MELVGTYECDGKVSTYLNHIVCVIINLVKLYARRHLFHIYGSLLKWQDPIVVIRFFSIVDMTDDFLLL